MNPASQHYKSNTLPQRYDTESKSSQSAHCFSLGQHKVFKLKTHGQKSSILLLYHVMYLQILALGI